MCLSHFSSSPPLPNPVTLSFLIALSFSASVCRVPASAPSARAEVGLVCGLLNPPPTWRGRDLRAL